MYFLFHFSVYNCCVQSDKRENNASSPVSLDPFWEKRKNEMKYIDGPGHTAHTTGNRVSPTGENRRIRHSLTCRRYTLGGRKKKKTENFYFILRLFSSSFDRNKREKNEEGRVTLGRLLPVNGDIKKRDGQRREKNPKEKKRLFITFMCVWLPSMFLLDKEMDIRRDIFFFLNIPSFSILHFLLKFYLEKKKKWIAPSSPPVSL